MGLAVVYLSLTAMVVAVFSFISMAVWVGARSQERRSRDRMVLLKSVAEQPSENARLVLELLREQDARKEMQARRQERRGMLQGGLILTAIGISLSIMVTAMTPRTGAWSVGMIPLSIGVVLLLFILFDRPAAASPHN
jgi:hypothetical protein